MQTSSSAASFAPPEIGRTVVALVVTAAGGYPRGLQKIIVGQHERWIWSDRAVHRRHCLITASPVWPSRC